MMSGAHDHAVQQYADRRHAQLLPFWAEHGGSAGLAGFIAMLEELDNELPAKNPLRKREAFEWLSRLRALKNIRIIALSQPAKLRAAA